MIGVRALVSIIEVMRHLPIPARGSLPYRRNSGRAAFLAVACVVVRMLNSAFVFALSADNDDLQSVLGHLSVAKRE